MASVGSRGNRTDALIALCREIQAQADQSCQTILLLRNYSVATSPGRFQLGM